MTPFPVAEFAYAITGRRCAYLVMLVAYFDESGTHGQASKVTSVAGLLGHSLEWSRLELPWKKRLRAIPERLGKIATFHATDCENQTEDFARFAKQALGTRTLISPK
jgi:hypothetical protein